MELLVFKLNLAFFIIAIILVIVILFLFYFKKWRHSLYGFVQSRDFLVSKEPSGIVFGKAPIIHRFVYSPMYKESHVLVLGGTGLGKTSCLLIPSLMAWHGPKFVIDVSGDIHPHIHERKYVLDPFGSNSVKFNVFAAIDKIEDRSDQDLELMKLAILAMPVEPNDSSAAQYFYKGGLKILQAALVCGYHQGLDFVDICRVVRFHSIDSLFEMFQENDKAFSIIASLRGQDPINLAGCKEKADLAVELFAMNRYISEIIGRGESSIDPSHLETGSVYVCVPISELTACEQFMHIITTQVISYVLSREYINTGKDRILLCLDELTALGKLDYLIDLLSRTRKNGVRTMVLTQSLADIEMVYPREYRSIIENCGIKVILGADELKSAQDISGMIGDYRTPEGKYEPFYRPEQLSKLGDDLVVLSRGSHMRLRKAPYYKQDIVKIAGI